MNAFMLLCDHQNIVTSGHCLRCILYLNINYKYNCGVTLVLQSVFSFIRKSAVYYA